MACSFTGKFYREVSSSGLESVLHTLRTVQPYVRYLEILNLMIPTLNDDPKEMREMCIWVKTQLGNDIPLHFDRFFPQYKLTQLPSTPAEMLK
jgi:pyruvate formate lyase activating enzyme